jgi:hypothetical protein
MTHEDHRVVLRANPRPEKCLASVHVSVTEPTATDWFQSSSTMRVSVPPA